MQKTQWICSDYQSKCWLKVAYIKDLGEIFNEVHFTMTPFEKYNYFKLSFIEDEINNVLANFRGWLTESDEKFSVKSKNIIDFELIRKKDEHDNKSFKFMLFEPLMNPGKTVFFASFADGWYTAVYNYSRVFKKEIYQIGLTVDSKLKTNPAYFFYNFKCSKSGEVMLRAVHLIKEEKGWDFYENADQVKPLKIENTKNYIARRKIDRLSTGIILNYMKKAGYDLINPEFFKTSKPVYYCKWH